VPLKTVPYGAWQSPITPDLIVGSVVGLGDVRLDGEDTYFLESRPAEGGRSVVMKRSADGKIAEVTPAPFNVRTRVHEYGGGAYAVHAGTVYFSNFADDRLYRVQPGQSPLALTPAVAMRYADACVDWQRGRLICVREDHTGVGEAVNTLVAVPMDPAHTSSVLVAGCDFYSSPRVSPDGTKLAWLSWNHPNMPWDGTELWTADIAHDGSLGSAQKVAGGPAESIFQPEFAPDGTLYFISDRSNWWNIYRLAGGRIEPVLVKDAEFGAAQWGFGMSTYGFRSAQEMICSYSQAGHTHVLSVDLSGLTYKEIDLGEFEMASGIRVAADRIGFYGTSETRPGAAALYEFASCACSVIKRSTDWVIDEAYIGRAEPIEFPTDGGLTAHGYYYAPKNPDFVGPQDERPPLLVICHGGPTSSTSIVFNLSIRYWTSRGFGVLDVNYGGSTGYGRAYRQRLNGQWGVVDVNDCTNGALYLVRRGDVDGARLAIKGGSAGGYTTMCVLTFRAEFAAGASYFGVSDAELLAKETHKFESRYMDSMIGPYPQRRDLYRERSPLNFTERLNRPIIFFQGLDDKIVLPNQAELMVEAMKRRGVPVAYVAFAGEGHGFRRSENIKQALENEFYFYSRIFRFEPADPVAKVPIYNLD